MAEKSKKRGYFLGDAPKLLSAAQKANARGEVASALFLAAIVAGIIVQVTRPAIMD